MQTKPSGTVRWSPTLLLIVGAAFPLPAQVLEKPPPDYRSPTIYRAGPAWFTVATVVPTRLDLRWAAVADATLYRLMRSSSADPTEQMIQEIPAGTGDQDLAGKYYFFFDNLPTRSGGVTFRYKAYAVFLGSDGSRTLSGPSPVASATALMPIAPPRLKSRPSVSQLLGRLKVTLDWGAVANATGYQVFQITRPPVPPLPMITTNVTRTAMVIDNVTPGQGGTVCVVTLYEGILKDDTVRSCELVLTQGP